MGKRSFRPAIVAAPSYPTRAEARRRRLLAGAAAITVATLGAVSCGPPTAGIRKVQFEEGLDAGAPDAGPPIVTAGEPAYDPDAGPDDPNDPQQ